MRETAEAETRRAARGSMGRQAMMERETRLWGDKRVLGQKLLLMGRGQTRSWGKAASHSLGVWGSSLGVWRSRILESWESGGYGL
jgi:hypothetical protein